VKKVRGSGEVGLSLTGWRSGKEPELDCERTRDLLDAFHDGELTTDLHEDVAKHLEGCGGCAEARDELATVDAALGAVEVPPMPPGPAKEIPGEVVAALAPAVAPVAVSGFWRLVRVGLVGAAIGSAFLVGLERWVEANHEAPPPSAEELERTRLSRTLHRFAFDARKAIEEGRPTEARTKLVEARAILADLDARFDDPEDTLGMVRYQMEYLEKSLADVPVLDTDEALRKARESYERNRDRGVPALLIPPLRSYAQALMNHDLEAKADEVMRESLRILDANLEDGARIVMPRPTYWGVEVASPFDPLWDLADLAEKLRRDRVLDAVLRRLSERASVLSDPLAWYEAGKAQKGLADIRRRAKEYRQAAIHSREAVKATLATLREIDPTEEELVGKLRTRVAWLGATWIQDELRAPSQPDYQRLVEDTVREWVGVLEAPPYGVSSWGSTLRDPAISLLEGYARAEWARGRDPLDAADVRAISMLEELLARTPEGEGDVMGWACEKVRLRQAIVEAHCGGFDCSKVSAVRQEQVRQIADAAEAEAEAAAALAPTGGPAFGQEGHDYQTTNRINSLRWERERLAMAVASTRPGWEPSADH
jgi:hypothetical protein